MKILLFSRLPNEKILLYTIIVFIILESLAGSFSIAMLIPMFQLMMVGGEGSSPLPGLPSFLRNNLSAVGESSIFIGLGFVLLCKSAVGLGRQLFESHLLKKLRHEWTLSLLQKIMFEPYATLESQRAGYSMNIASREILRAGNYVTAVLTFLSSGAYVIAISVTAAVANWKFMAVTSVVLLFLYIAVLRHVISYSRENGNKTLQLVQELMAQVNENLVNLKEIKILNIERWRLQTIARRSREVGTQEMRYALIQALPVSLNEAMFALVAISFGAALAAGWSPDPKKYIPFLPFFAVAAYKVVTSAASLASHRIKAINREPSFVAVCDLGAAKQECLEDGFHVDRLGTDIEMENVSFSYPDGTRVFEELWLKIELGKTIFLKGKSGTGKSTLLDLLTRLRKVDRGQIRANQEDISLYTLKSWRHLFGYVGQDPQLFYGTVFENIALDQLVGPDEVRWAARIAGIADFIETLPDQYQYVVDERGLNFSGGQRRRIALARALIRNPQIILLDETTSAFESALEREILMSLKKIGGITVIVVSHRVDNLDLADRIIEIG